VAGKEGISILTCETACGALRRGLVWLKMSPINSLSDHCGVFPPTWRHRDPTVVIERVNLKPYQTPPPVVCPSCPLCASCGRSPSSVPLYQLCRQLGWHVFGHNTPTASPVLSWCFPFLMFSFLDVFFCLFKKFLLLECDFR